MTGDALQPIVAKIVPSSNSVARGYITEVLAGGVKIGRLAKYLLGSAAPRLAKVVTTSHWRNFILAGDLENRLLD